MCLVLSLALLVVLAGCGDADTPAVVVTDQAFAAEPAAPTTPPTAQASSAELRGTAHDASLGTFTLRFAESEADDAPFAEVGGFLPPLVPSDAFPTYTLVDSPNYHVTVDKSTLPDAFELSGTHFVYVKRKPDGTFDSAKLLLSWAGLSNTHMDGTLSGIVGGFTLAPIWRDGAPAPGLTYHTIGDGKRPFATTALPVFSQPAWVQPLTLPATVEDPEVTAEVDLTVELEDDPTFYLLYREKPGRSGKTTWDLRALTPNRRVNRTRARSDDPATPTTTAYTLAVGDLGEGPTEAYLLAFPE